MAVELEINEKLKALQADYGVKDMQMPLTPQRVWEAMNKNENV